MSLSIGPSPSLIPDPESSAEDLAEWFYYHSMVTWGSIIIYEAFYHGITVPYELRGFAPNHHIWRNPSRSAILRTARASSIYPSFSNAFSIAMRTSPLFAFATLGLGGAALLGKAQREGWLGLGGNFYQGDLPDDYVHPNYQTKRPTYTSDKIRPG